MGREWVVGQQEQGGCGTGVGGALEGGLILASAGRGERAGREEGREGEWEAEVMKMFFHLLPGEKGPGCDRENDGKSHWSCWFERICLWNKLFISQL